MIIARLWREWYRRARLKRAGRRELDTLSDHLRYDIGVLHVEPGTGAGAGRATAPTSPLRRAVVLHLHAGGPDTPQATRNLRPDRVVGHSGTRAA